MKYNSKELNTRYNQVQIKNLDAILDKCKEIKV